MRATWSEVFKVFLMLFALASCPGLANSQTPTPEANNSTGNPWDFRAGLSLFPFHNRVVRWNNEFLYLLR